MKSIQQRGWAPRRSGREPRLTRGAWQTGYVHDVRPVAPHLRIVDLCLIERGIRANLERSMSLLRAQINALHARAARGMVLGLDRITRALADLGDPHRSLAVVHVAGSNGKGSTCAMVESIARSAGLSVGLYTSPHLCRFAERIRINGAPVADGLFSYALGRALALAEELTFFELFTLAAFVAFRQAKVDLVIMEVGLGGRLDATNVLSAPIATAITSISLEHTALLGDTLSAIAREKAGIFKPGCPVVLGVMPSEAKRAAIEVAHEVSAGPIHEVVWARSTDPLPGVSTLEVSMEGGVTVIRASDASEVRARLGLLGAHQSANAGVAVGLARHLAARFPERDWEEAMRRGLALVTWPGRMEVIDLEGVEMILDGAHNIEGVRAFLSALEGGRFGLGLGPVDPQRTSLVFGAMDDKRHDEMLALLAPLAERRYYTAPKGRAPAPPAAFIKTADGIIEPEPRDAIAAALGASVVGDRVIVTGSLYLVGEARASILGIDTDPVVGL